TVAGNGKGTFGRLVGVGGPARKASRGQPTAVAVAGDGRVLIADSGWVLRVDADGILRAVAHLRKQVDAGGLPAYHTELAPEPDGSVLVLEPRVIDDSTTIEQVMPDGDSEVSGG